MKRKTLKGVELQCENAATTTSIAELEARNLTLDSELAALNGKTDAISVQTRKAKEMEISANNSEISAKRNAEKYAAIEAKDLARRETDADAEVARLIEAEFVQPRDKDKQTELRAKFVADPSLIGLFATGAKATAAVNAKRVGSAQSSEVMAASQRALNGGTVSVSADLRGALRAIAITGTQAAGKHVALQAKFEASREIGRIYKTEISGIVKKGEDFPLTAADYSGGTGTGDATNQLGILSGTLVAHRTLDLYKYEFPILSAITTDFSDQPAQYKQTTTTRIIVVPAVLSYNSTPDSTGRPVGYTIVTPAQTVDAPITLSYHRAVDVVFDANTLASTTRNLFGEQAEANAYALGLDVVNNLYGVITPANFGGAGNNPAFSVPLINYGRPTFSKAKRVLNLQGVPYNNRFALSNSYMQEQLEQDPTLVSLAVFQKPEIITDSQLPQIARFTPYEAPNLPATAVAGVGNGQLAAFFGHRSALLMQSRIPNDWSTVLGTNSGYGLVSVVTNPDTGLSVLLVQFSNPQSAHAEYRLALIYGLAAGNPKGGQIVTN
jgi:hypothetical protein